LSGGWQEICAAESTPAERGDRTFAGFRHLALRVDSPDAARAELTGHGVRFTEGIRPVAGGGKALFSEDGEDKPLHPVERPADWQPGKA
jgi:catechol 2,3-dioxygenase-like lactoylglutathione lyase family enzyme